MACLILDPRNRHIPVCLLESMTAIILLNLTLPKSHVIDPMVFATPEMGHTSVG